LKWSVKRSNFETRAPQLAIPAISRILTPTQPLMPTPMRIRTRTSTVARLLLVKEIETQGLQLSLSLSQIILFVPRLLVRQGPVRERAVEEFPSVSSWGGEVWHGRPIRKRSDNPSVRIVKLYAWWESIHVGKDGDV
jgi:hypothetical protein